jgi:UDP-glucose 4-epimerase
MLLNYKAPKRYLVTGGCGFIGSHLVDALIANKHEVVILDNLSTGKRENAHPNANLIVGDTTDYPTVEAALRGVHGCFHLAAVASVEKSVHEWAKTHTVNITSTVNIFQAASRKENKIPVVYTSSAAVYGDCLNFPISEKEEAKPLTAYGADKLSCDLHARVAWLVHGVRNIGLRPFNVYGPRQDPSSPYSGVISIFTDRLQRGLPITVYGDGEQVRDFVYVTDAVKSFTAAMAYLEDADNASGHDIINLCTGRATSINKLIDTIATVANQALIRNHAPARKGDIRISVGDPSKMAKLLGQKLDVTLLQGLGEMMESPLEEVRWIIP